LRFRWRSIGGRLWLLAGAVAEVFDGLLDVASGLLGGAFGLGPLPLAVDVAGDVFGGVGVEAALAELAFDLFAAWRLGAGVGLVGVGVVGERVGVDAAFGEFAFEFALGGLAFSPGLLGGFADRLLELLEVVGELLPLSLGELIELTLDLVHGVDGFAEVA
jgi:hypothetical protein